MQLTGEGQSVERGGSATIGQASSEADARVSVLIVDHSATVDHSIATSLRGHGYSVELVTSVAQAVCNLQRGPACLVFVHDTGTFATNDLLLLARAPSTRRVALLSGREAPVAERIAAAGVHMLPTPLQTNDLLSIVEATRPEDTRSHRLPPRKTRTERAIPRVLDRPCGWRVRGEFEVDADPSPDPESVPRCVPWTVRPPRSQNRTRETLGYLPTLED
ncbi:MAG: hypothetical protein ACRBN8_39870 [Nannocystales bacterium]